MYALISASIRTSTNSGFAHAMFHHLLSRCNENLHPLNQSVNKYNFVLRYRLMRRFFGVPLCPHAHAT
jgi:hypothetical protein